jgi:hypothetical protein
VDEVTRKGPASGKGRGGAARGYSWPPFAPGNTIALAHGASSERSVAPLAEKIATGLLTHGSCPDYLLEPAYAPVIAAWSRAEAVTQLLWQYLGGMDAEKALSETIAGEEDETHGDGGRVTRRSRSTRILSVLGELHRAETRAMNLRGRLGLDPLSRAKIAKDIGLAQRASDDALTRLGETGKAIRERRAAELRLVAGGEDDQPA